MPRSRASRASARFRPTSSANSSARTSAWTRFASPRTTRSTTCSSSTWARTPTNGRAFHHRQPAHRGGHRRAGSCNQLTNMAEEKDIIGRDEPLNEDASTPETDGAADESPAADAPARAGVRPPDAGGGGVRKLTGMYKNWFLDYASYVILERAVPHVEDGLKPVQRRILHAMKVVDDGRYNKVANIVGQTMQYHPHGDASIKDALVQLGQKDLLIDCQGNWGNILTGDECRRGALHRGAPVEVRLRSGLQQENHRVDAVVRRPQGGARHAADQVPAAAGAGLRRHRRGSGVEDPAPQLRGASMPASHT